MTAGKRLLWIAVIAFAVGATMSAAIVVDWKPSLSAGFPASIGGRFAMTTHDGRRLTDVDLRGKPFGIFFGFTQCPDVCPTSMLEVAHLLEALGGDAGKIRFLFVTVDPERDTPDLLRDYLSSFDKRIVGLRGTPEETANIVRAYRVFYSKVPTKEGYTINHTATMYLMGADGRFAKTIAFGEDEKTRLRKVRDLIAAANPAS